jgi:hypothetical protein
VRAAPRRREAAATWAAEAEKTRGGGEREGRRRRRAKAWKRSAVCGRWRRRRSTAAVAEAGRGEGTGTEERWDHLDLVRWEVSAVAAATAYGWAASTKNWDVGSAVGSRQRVPAAAAMEKPMVRGVRWLLGSTPSSSSRWRGREAAQVPVACGSVIPPTESTPTESTRVFLVIFFVTNETKLF